MNELPAGTPQKGNAQNDEQQVSWKELLVQAIEDVEREAHEVALMLEQSQAEVNRLGQKSASIAAYARQMRERQQWEEMGKAFETALEAQQRYLIMRGQLEKLQQAYETLERFQKTLTTLQATASAEPRLPEGEGKSALAVLEMLVQAQEAERQRLSRQMHDGPAQALSNFILQTEIASRLFEVDPARAREELRTLKSSAATTFQQVREFIFELRPMMLDDLGLVPTVRRYLGTLDKQVDDAAVKVEVVGQERRYAPYLEVFVFRAIQELVSVALHDRKALHVTVQLTLEEREVKVAVEDDGTPVDETGIEKGTEVGLRLLRDRVEMLGGSMSVSSQPGSTRISFEILAPEE